MEKIQSGPERVSSEKLKKGLEEIKELEGFENTHTLLKLIFENYGHNNEFRKKLEQSIEEIKGCNKK